MSGELNGNDTPTQAAMPAVGVPESVALLKMPSSTMRSMNAGAWGAGRCLR